MRLGADAQPRQSRSPGTSAAPAEGGYKPHVDGLRAISIVAVVAYHAGVPGFGGGFVGVDIFFVISGFLIINQIVAGLEAGRFGIFDFYARRALRILPAYFVMLAVTVAIATILLRAPADLRGLARSAILAPTFLTNVYFWLSSGYFDTSADLKPLLHTWSLAVEEQFYLVVPLLMAGLFALARKKDWRPRRLLAVAAAIIAATSCDRSGPPRHRADRPRYRWWRGADPASRPTHSAVGRLHPMPGENLHADAPTAAAPRDARLHAPADSAPAARAPAPAHPP